MSEILSLKDVSFTYPRGKKEALKKVNLSFCAGERVAILGNNGAGKTTLFSLCCGLLSPQEGEILLDGKKVGRDKKALHKAVGIVFQEPDNQIIASTVYEEVSFGPLNLSKDKAAAKLRTDAAISLMALEDYCDRAPHRLSGGEKKRVTVADVLAMDARLLLLDEPTASLDPVNTERLEAHLNALSQKGYALLVSTHDIDFAYRFADRVLVLSDGVLLADGKPEEVFLREEVLQKAGLCAPTLWTLSRVVLPGIKIPPHTVDDFCALYNMQKGGDNA